MLFWDPVLSGNRDTACATCHHPDFAYADGRDLSGTVQAATAQNTARAHVTAGVIWLVTLLFIDRRRDLGPADALAVDICALYWHFVDVVWIALFATLYFLK